MTFVDETADSNADAVDDYDIQHSAAVTPSLHTNPPSYNAFITDTANRRLPTNQP